MRTMLTFQDHPNLGLCLDVAHPPLAPPPPHSYGWDTLTGAGWSEEDFSAMIKRMETIPAEKIFYIELSQVLDPKPPLASGSPFDEFYNHPTTSDMRAKGESLVWAYCARPVPLVGRNAGLDYRPEDQLSGDRVVVQLKALLGTGFKGQCDGEQSDNSCRSHRVRNVRSHDHVARLGEHTGQIRLSLRQIDTDAGEGCKCLKDR